MRALRNEGHFVPATRAGRHLTRQLMRVAAAIALFAGGVATGHYALAKQETGKQIAPVNQANGSKRTPDNSVGTQTVKNSETVVAEREMWL